jgi:glycerate 2-kinase
VIRNREDLLGIEAPEPVVRRRARALDAVDAALAAVDPVAATTRGLEQLAAEGFPLDGCVVFAFGKASLGMAQAVLAACRPRGGVVLGFDEGAIGPLTLHQAGHPSPRTDAPRRGREVMELARSLGPDDLALCLVSGGGSAMLELPNDGLTLEGLAARSRQLMLDGAAIGELNRVRAAMSQLKGGQLARAMAPARIANLVLSDVPGHGPEVVASGPTVVPGASTIVVADNASARQAAAAALGLVPDPQPIVGIAVEQGAAFYGSSPSRVGGGETTVVVTGAGRGGRNQEFVLGAAHRWRGGLLLSVGTDGVDGSSDAAGALIDDVVLERAAAAGLSIPRILAANDSDALFRAAGGRIETGPTGTNVADLHIRLP